MDPFVLQGAGAYGGNGSMAAAGTVTGVDSLPAITNTNDMLMFPFLDNYRAQLDSFDATSGNLDYTYPGRIGMAPVDTSQMYTQMQRTQEQMMDFNMRQQQRYRYNNAEVTAPLNKLTLAATTLQSKILENEQDQIEGALQAFVQAYRQAYDPEGTMDNETALANAVTEYQKLTGKSLLADIKDNGSSAFMSGFVRSATFGLFGDRTTADENIAKVTGQPVSEASKKWHTVGRVAGKAATGAAAGAAIGAAVTSWSGGWGAIIGAVVGGIWGFLS